MTNPIPSPQDSAHATPHGAAAEPLVRLRGVGKSYPGVMSTAAQLRSVINLALGRSAARGFTALRGIDLEIRAGESWGIIGENGAGKSTLMKIVAGVTRPSEGQRAVRGKISALLELGTGFHPEFTGRENVYVASALMGWDRRQTAEQMGAILAFADIGTHIDQPVKTYSTGMVVRLGFAVATTLKPDLLVTDEILAVGDESFQKKCLRWMEDYRANGGSLLLCSHSMYHVQTL
ncbi:MAG: ABC transporter ATP-binding protein, partial [Betaproteobacteria bacterium]|nr:ABC transporter ATP-binding protein [Betaproteobacteria bacterium]